MEPLLETISLNLEEPNELLFKVKVEGADPAPAKVRLVCEGNDCSFMFNGSPTGDDIVQFNLPTMKDKLKEGTYLGRVEVLVENRYFVPVQFQINYKKLISVVAESISVNRPVKREIVVSAEPVVIVEKKINEKVIPVEEKPLKPAKTLKENYGKKSSLVRSQKPVQEDDSKIIHELVQSFMKREKPGRSSR